MGKYKLIRNDEDIIFGVATHDSFMRWSATLGIVFATEEDGQFIAFRDRYYRDDWLRAVGNPGLEVEPARIVEISDAEYELLAGEFAESDEGIPDTGPEPEPEPEPAPEPVPGIGQVRAIVLADMSKACEAAILAGTDAMLSDRQDHHFAMSVLDQINIVSLQARAAAGEEPLPYHADGEPMSLYSARDIATIAEAMQTHRMYHLLYLECLRGYIASMDSIEMLLSVSYGMTVPEEYRTDVFEYYFGR